MQRMCIARCEHREALERATLFWSVCFLVIFTLTVNSIVPGKTFKSTKTAHVEANHHSILLLNSKK